RAGGRAPVLYPDRFTGPICPEASAARGISPGRVATEPAPRTPCARSGERAGDTPGFRPTGGNPTPRTPWFQGDETRGFHDRGGGFPALKSRRPYFSSLMAMLRNCTRLGGPFQAPVLAFQPP